MSDVIRKDIEKIERALNIRVDDVEIEVTLNATFPPPVIIEQSNETPLSSHYSFATDLNLCYQRNLFQLYKHSQSIETSNNSTQSNHEILPIQTFEIYTENISNLFPTNNDSIQHLRRIMQREEKARLTSNETIEKLIEIVGKNLRENQEHEYNRKIEILRTSTRNKILVEKEILDLKIRLDNLRDLSNRDLIQQQNHSIDWTTISQIFMNNQYTDKSCRHAWEQICLPMLNLSSKWSSEEDQLLKNLVQIHGSYADKWTLIASHFSHRSAFMCANRYMFLENTRLDKIKFSTEQIYQLKNLIKKYQQGYYIPLNKIAYKFACSLSTIRREWRNIDPHIRRGQWKLDEDQILLKSVLKQSNRETINWNLVADDVSGRSQTKCYHRYIHLTRKQKSNDFQTFEDQLLIEQHRLQNARWSQIQLAFPDRSCYTLQNRYRKLLQYRQINELFQSQSSQVQSFILKYYPSKTLTNSLIDSLYRPPNIQLNYNQLQSLTSNCLFIQFCHQFHFNQLNKSLSIRQLLNIFSNSKDIQEIYQMFFCDLK